MPSRVTLTARGWFAVLIGVAGVWGATMIALPDLAYLGATILAVVLFALLSLFVARRLGTPARTLSSDILLVGQPATVAIDVRAQSLLPTPAGEWKDSLPSAFMGDVMGAFMPIASSLTRGEQNAHMSYTVEPVGRGVHVIGPLTISMTDAFALWRRTTRLASTTPATIAPALVPLAALPSSAGESGGSLHSTTSHLGEGADNLIARPYAPGDSMRRIHWRATAHRDELMVRQEERESTPRAVVVLDRAESRWKPAAAQSRAQDPAFETALSLCVSVAARLLYEGYLVVIVDQDGTELCDPLAEESDIAGMLSAFATLTSHGGDHLAMLRSLMPEGGSGPFVVITAALTFADAADISPLAHASSFAVLFAAETESEPLAECHYSGWRTSMVASATVRQRDDAVTQAWLTVLEQGVARVN